MLDAGINKFGVLLYLLFSCFDARYDAKLRFLILQLQLFKKNLGKKRVALKPAEKEELLLIGKELNHQIKDILFIVTWQTYRSWLRKQKNGAELRKLGRPRKVTTEIQSLIIRLATENLQWGYRRIAGELKKLGVFLTSQTVKRVLKDNNHHPKPDKRFKRKPTMQWKVFLNLHMNTLVACDFFCKKIWSIHGCGEAYCLFFIHLGSRRVWCSPTTFSPNGEWLKQQTRNVCMWFDDLEIAPRYLIRDRDGKFAGSFDWVFKERGINIIKTAVAKPNMNSYAERFVRSVKYGCLNNYLGFSLTQLDYILREYCQYYNNDRPHQGIDIGNKVLDPDFVPSFKGTVKCKKRLGGLLKSYYRDAA